MSRPEIHLFNPLWNAAGGSEWRTIELYRELAPHADVQMWTDREPDPILTGKFPIRQVDEASGSYPDGGTLVIVGVAHPKRWLKVARPRRVIVVYNMLAPRFLLKLIHSLLKHNVQQVEIVYASEGLRQRTKLPGIVEPSPIDLGRFCPRPTMDDRGCEEFVIGRLSRDVAEKHHEEDLALYADCLAAGCRVCIMGGTCLANCGVAPSGLNLLAAGSQVAEALLQSLDCFVYRTSPKIWETFGRVVFEAMACGLPVVCHREGGYATSIRQGENGFLFETTAEALGLIRRLQQDRALCARVGAAARETVEAMYSAEERAKVVEYYLR